LHDWTDLDNWEGMHHLWMTEIFLHLRHTLPPPFRVFIGSSPQVAVGGSPVKPVREPDFEAAVITVEDDDTTVAAVELVSPRNKDRPSARDQYGARSMNYLIGGVHLLLIDVHRRPVGLSFPQLIATAFDPRLPAPPAPCAVAYRVGAAAAAGGRMLAVWREPLTVGQPLPVVTLPLTLDLAVPIDLDATYSEAATNCYLT